MRRFDRHLSGKGAIRYVEGGDRPSPHRQGDEPSRHDHADALEGVLRGRPGIGHGTLPVLRLLPEAPRWAAANKVSMRIERKPAQEMQVDYVGDTMEVLDADTGEARKVYVFVACLPYSGEMFAEGAYNMRAESWSRPTSTPSPSSAAACR